MKILTEEEFQDRTQAVLRAKNIFVDSGVTKNITLAFMIYQSVCAERERQLFISSQVYGKLESVMDRYERPKCPDCEADMMFRPVAENPDGIKIQIVCSKCDTVLNDKNDLNWWMANLRKKDERTGVSQDTKEGQQGG